MERLPPIRPAGYDAEAIAAHLAALTDQDRDWDLWFEEQGIRPHRIGYETLADAPGAVLARLLRAIGADPGAADGVAVPTARLADATSRDWRARFLIDRPDLAP